MQLLVILDSVDTHLLVKYFKYFIIATIFSSTTCIIKLLVIIFLQLQTIYIANVAERSVCQSFYTLCCTTLKNRKTKTVKMVYTAFKRSSLKEINGMSFLAISSIAKEPGDNSAILPLIITSDLPSHIP